MTNDFKLRFIQRLMMTDPVLAAQLKWNRQKAKASFEPRSHSQFYALPFLSRFSVPSFIIRTRVVKFQGIYSPGNISGNITRYISKLGINGNKFQSLKFIRKPIWKNSKKSISKNCFTCYFWKQLIDILT